MDRSLERYAPLIGRILLSVIFLFSAFGKVTHFSGMEQFMASKGMPAVPVLLVLALLTEALGGLSLLLGFKARWGALLLFLFLIPTTLIFHDFWALTGAMRQDMQIHFLKNLAIMGGLLMVAANGPGAFSLDKPAKGR
ncbi:MAG: DoxX family protein [Acidobacteriota bacterium]